MRAWRAGLRQVAEQVADAREQRQEPSRLGNRNGVDSDGDFGCGKEPPNGLAGQIGVNEPEIRLAEPRESRRQHVGKCDHQLACGFEDGGVGGSRAVGFVVAHAGTKQDRAAEPGQVLRHEVPMTIGARSMPRRSRWAPPIQAIVGTLLLWQSAAFGTEFVGRSHMSA